VVSRGVIKAVSKDATIPDEAWVIEGKGLIVYPDSSIRLRTSAFHRHPRLRRQAEKAVLTPSRLLHVARKIARERRHGEARPIEASLSDKRVETWRSGGFTTVVSAPKGGMFPGQAAVLNLGGETQWRHGGANTCRCAHFSTTYRELCDLPRLADGLARLRTAGLAGYGLEHQSSGHFTKKILEG